MGSFSALIVAGGTGSRMGATVPKQFLELSGEPVLMHTIRKFSETEENPEIILVLPADHIDTWAELCNKYNFTVSHKVITGGATRAGSVVNGLKVIDPSSVVAIHDGVRPLASSTLISRCFREALKFRSSIPAVNIKDTIREIKGAVTISQDRDRYKLVQTPQCFKTSEILDCYLSAPLNIYTDDAGIAEVCGIPIHLTEGEETNIKITTPADMVIAEALIKTK